MFPVCNRLAAVAASRRPATAAALRFFSNGAICQKPASSGLQEKTRTFLNEDHPTFEDLPNPRAAPRPKTETLTRPIVDPKDKYTEQSAELHKFGRYIMGCMPKFVQQFSVWKDELTLYVAPTAEKQVAIFLRDHTASQFKACMDVTAADYPTRKFRFDVIYDLLSVRFNSRIRIKTYASEVSPVPSLVGVWPGCDWFERETYDLYGVFFEGHPDLRRIMTDYGFEGHPLRKDFPSIGYTEVRYDAEKHRLVYEPVEMTQAWRNFRVGSSVWDQVGDGVDASPADFKLPKPVLEEKDPKAKK